MTDPRSAARHARQVAGRVRRAARGWTGRPHEVAVLLRSPLFDHDWYSHCVGEPMTRLNAVRHYLAHGREHSWTPNPMFDPEFFVRRRPDLVVEGEDPFVTYIGGRHWWAPVHPLVMVRRYNHDFPEALDYPTGPIGHYRDRGAKAQARINNWFQDVPGHGPAGLVDWLWDQVGDWHDVHRHAQPLWGPTPPHSGSKPVPSGATQTRGTVSVLLPVEYDVERALRTLRTILAQSHRDIEVFVAGGGEDFAWTDLVLPEDDRIRAVPVNHETRWAALNALMEEARGPWVAFATEGDEWLPHRLTALMSAVGPETGWAHDVAEDLEPGTSRRFVQRPASHSVLRAGARGEIGMVLAPRAVLDEVGGFDESFHAAAEDDYLLRLSALREPVFVSEVGIHLNRRERRHSRERLRQDEPWLDHDDVRGYRDLALSSALIDWPSVAAREVDEELVSIVMPTYKDFLMTEHAVRHVVEAAEAGGQRVEVLVVDNGCPQAPSVALASLGTRYPRVRVLRFPVNHGFALGSNLGLQQAQGATVVFLNNDTEVRPGWLDPLRNALAAPDVLAAQSLLVYGGGSIQSAGVVFPPGGGVPHALLQGFPREDAQGLAGLHLHALTGAALAVRRTDAVELQGFDPTFRNGMEDIDFCLRLRQLRAGHCVVVPDSEVIHQESRTEGRFAHAMVNRKVFLERWRGRLPADDDTAWAAAGFRVLGREIRQKPGPDRRIAVVEPVVDRIQRPHSADQPPRLRWAIKHSAPYGAVGESWGDTHFARQLADSLRRLGQEVVVDHRDEWDRPTSWHDDVVLLLRGRRRYSPNPEQVNLMWLISHPELLVASEGLGWDRVYVASAKFADTLRSRWPVPVDVLYQATDPVKFHPDRALPDTGFPLLFLGNSRKQKRPMVMAALEHSLPLTLIGADWHGVVPEGCVKAEYMANDEVGAAYRAAEIVLNDHWEDMRDQGFISNRLFDAVASGARVISDDVVGLREVFGDAVQVVRNSDELAALVRNPDRDAIFGTDADRRARAAQMASGHSFDVRAQVLLDDAVRAWRRREA